ncbi:30624_t:CDS:2, partial [Racocetra persica]
SDGAITEFQAQEKILTIQTSKQLSIHDNNLNVHFSCLIFDNIGLIIRVQDSKHAKKTAHNALMSEARLLTFGISSAQYSYLLNLIEYHDSIMYRNDVVKLDHQDDSAAYRTFCSANLKLCLISDYKIQPGIEVLLVKAHREYYPQIPLISWIHETESCEHFFDTARQINSDFNFAEIIQMLPKISQHIKVQRDNKLNFEKNKLVRE